MGKTENPGRRYPGRTRKAKRVRAHDQDADFANTGKSILILQYLSFLHFLLANQYGQDVISSLLDVEMKRCAQKALWGPVTDTEKPPEKQWSRRASRRQGRRRATATAQTALEATGTKTAGERRREWTGQSGPPRPWKRSQLVYAEVPRAQETQKVISGKWG